MVNTVRQTKDKTPREIFEFLPNSSYQKVTTLDKDSMIFLIALIKRGLCNDN